MHYSTFTSRARAALGIFMVTAPLACDPQPVEIEAGREEGSFEPAAAGKGDDARRAAAFSWPVIRPGDQSQVVVAAQYLLREHGQELSLNGLFDETTRRSVVNFQRDAGLDDDGVVGNFTWETLVITVRAGDEDSWAVKAVQDMLANRYGYDVELSANYDAVTEAQIRRFQADRCLSFADGIAGPETWNALVADIDYCSQAGRVLELHNRGELELLDTDFGRNDGADPLANITDAAAGRNSRRSCNHAGGGIDPRLPCGSVRLDDQLLDAMVSLHDDYGFSYVVTAISGARHSPGSLHYAGLAFDIGVIDGVLIRGDSSVSRRFVQACRELGAREALGPHNDSGHFDHVHCAF